MSRRMMFWNKDGKGSKSSTDVTQHSAAESGYEEPKDVGVFSLFGPFIKNYASSMSHTKNPAKLPYPTCFYLPQSSLMHMVHLQMSHVDTLINATMQATPEERFLGVVQYTLSSWELTKFPYKPIISLLGETAHYSSTYAGGSDPADKTYVLAENLRKDPPISLFHISNPAHGLSYEGMIEMSPKFKQAHVHVSFIGQNNITFTHPQGLYKEEFRSEIPDLMIRLLRMHTELAGEVNVTSSTGFAAKITFKEKSLFSKAKNVIVGSITFNGVEIYAMDGAWDDIVYLTDRRTNVRSELLNRTGLYQNVLEIPPMEQLPMTACDRIWGDMLASLLRQDFNTAGIIKAQIMQDENRIIEDMKMVGETYVPRYFRKNANGLWEIKDPALARDTTKLAQMKELDPSLEMKFANMHTSVVDPALVNNQGSVYATPQGNIYSTNTVYSNTVYSNTVMPTM